MLMVSILSVIILTILPYPSFPSDFSSLSVNIFSWIDNEMIGIRLPENEKPDIRLNSLGTKKRY